MTDKELTDTICAMVRHGYDDAVLELCEWLTDRDNPELQDKLLDMLDSKKPLNTDGLLNELNNIHTSPYLIK